MRCIFFLSFIMGSTGWSFGQGTFERGLEEYLHGSVDSSVVLLTKAIAQNDQPARAHVIRGAAYTWLDDFARGRADLDSAKALDPNAPQLAYYYGRWHFGQNQYQQAMDFFNAAIREDSTDAHTWNFRAICRSAMGDHAGAILDEDKAILLDPKNDEYWTNRGWAYVMQENYPAAIKDFTASLAVMPNQKAYADRGYVHLRQENYAMAIPDLTRSLEFVPEDRDVLYYRGLCNGMVGNVEASCADHKKSAALGHKKAAELAALCL